MIIEEGQIRAYLFCIAISNFLKVRNKSLFSGWMDEIFKISVSLSDIKVLLSKYPWSSLHVR